MNGSQFYVEINKQQQFCIKTVAIPTEVLQTLENIQQVVRDRLVYVEGAKDGYAKRPLEELYEKLKEIAQSIRDEYKIALSQLSSSEESKQTFKQIIARVNGIENLVSPPPFLQLPSEIIVHIFSFLRINQIWKSFLVSKDICAHAKAAEQMRRLEFGCEEETFFMAKVSIEIYSLLPSVRNAIFNKKLYKCAWANRGGAVKLRMLLECGAKPDGYIGETGYSSLIYAAMNNKPYSVWALLTFGANVNHHNNYGDTALHWAVYNQNARMVKDLLDYGANPNAGEDIQHTPLLPSSLQEKKCCLSIVKLLVKAKVNLNHQNKSGDTSLHLAAKNGQTALVKFLLAHGAKPNIKCKSGKTPLQLAEEANKISKDREKYQEIIALLKLDIIKEPCFRVTTNN
jgi:ankyrin repeat protein